MIAQSKCVVTSVHWNYQSWPKPSRYHIKYSSFKSYCYPHAAGTEIENRWRIQHSHTFCPNKQLLIYQWYRTTPKRIPCVLCLLSDFHWIFTVQWACSKYQDTTLTRASHGVTFCEFEAWSMFYLCQCIVVVFQYFDILDCIISLPDCMFPVKWAYWTNHQDSALTDVWGTACNESVLSDGVIGKGSTGTPATGWV